MTVARAIALPSDGTHAPVTAHRERTRVLLAAVARAIRTRGIPGMPEFDPRVGVHRDARSFPAKATRDEALERHRDGNRRAFDRRLSANRALLRETRDLSAAADHARTAERAQQDATAGKRWPKTRLLNAPAGVYRVRRSPPSSVTVAECSCCVRWPSFPPGSGGPAVRPPRRIGERGTERLPRGPRRPELCVGKL